MKTFSERHANESARRPAASPDARHGVSASARAHTRDVAQRERIDSAFGVPLQRVEDDEDLQRKTEGPMQRREDEEEPLQGRFDTVQRQGEEEPLQGRFGTAQRQGDEEEEALQTRADAGHAAAVQSAASPGGLPPSLRRGVEALSGMDLSDVQVHTGSSKPSEIQAHAYAQGNEIHVAPGQEQHMAHEAWHVVQQRQGRVQPTKQVGEIWVNDDARLEAEADRMGGLASMTVKSRGEI